MIIFSVSFHLREKIYFFADKINDRLYIRLVRIRGVKFMEVVIVDDEKVIREQIKKLTVKYEPDCNVIAYETGEELLAEGKKFDVVSAVQEVLYALFQGYCLQYFLGAFLESRLSRSKWNSLFVTVLYVVLKLVLNLLIPSGYESIIIIEKQLLLLFMLLVLALCLYRAVHTITVFLVVTFMAVSESSFFLAYMIMTMGSKVFLLWESFLEKGYIASVDSFMTILKITECGLQVLLYVVSVSLLYFLLKKVVQSYREKDYVIHRTELLFILVPGMVGLLLCILLRVIIVAVENGVPKLLYDKYPVLILIVPVILILSLLSILYGIKLFQDMIYLNREKNSRIILENQNGSMQEHMTEMERVYSGIRSMKHDMKNTLAVILQLADQNSEKNAEHLLFPDNLLIQSYDIGIILGNALDNAIEACRKLEENEPNAETFIRLSSFPKGKMIFIEIENSFDGKVIRKRQSEFPVTDKADREAHGIGFANIKNAAEKYHGAVDWSVNNKVFTLLIMMRNERS